MGKKKSIAKKVLEKQEDKMQEERDLLYKQMKERCIPVAQKIIQIIHEDGLDMGDAMLRYDQQGKPIPLAPGERPPKYATAAEKIMEFMLSQNLLKAEWEIIFQLVRQPVDMLESIVINDLNRSFTRGLYKAVGAHLGIEVESFSELTMGQMDTLLKMFAKKEEPKEEVKTEEDEASEEDHDRDDET